MYKLIFPLLALASVAPVAQAAGFWTIQGAEYRVDTLEHYKAGPGTTITVIDAVGPVKQREIGRASCRERVSSPV